MEEKEVNEAVAEPVIEPVAPTQTNESLPTKEPKKKKKGTFLIILNGFLFFVTFFMFGLSIFTLLLPIGGAIFSILIVFGLFMADAVLSVGTIFLIWLSEDFRAWNGEVMDMAQHINDVSQQIMNVVQVVVPIIVVTSLLSFVVTWIVTIIGLATTKRTIFKVNLIILILITSVFALVAIATLILNFIPK